MMQTHGVGWTMANGWPVPGETSSVTLAQEIGAALENPDVTMGLKKAFSENGAVTVEDLKVVPHGDLLDSIVANGMKQTMLMQLTKYVFGDQGSFPQPTFRTNSSLSLTDDSSTSGTGSVHSSAPLFYHSRSQ